MTIINAGLVGGAKLTKMSCGGRGRGGEEGSTSQPSEMNTFKL